MRALCARLHERYNNAATMRAFVRSFVLGRSVMRAREHVWHESHMYRVSGGTLGVTIDLLIWNRVREAATSEKRP